MYTHILRVLLGSWVVILTTGVAIVNPFKFCALDLRDNAPSQLQSKVAITSNMLSARLTSIGYGTMTGAAWSSDGKLLAISTMLHIWLFQTDNWNAVPERIRSPSGAFIGVMFLPGTREIITASKDRTVRHWNLNTQENRVLFRTESMPETIALSPDGVYIAVDEGHDIRLWNRLEDRQIAVLTGHQDSIMALAFSPDSTLLASSSWDYNDPIFVWEAATGAQRIAFSTAFDDGPVTDRRARSLSFTQDGSYLLSGHHDRNVRVWDVRRRQWERTLNGWHDWVSGLAIRPSCEVAQGCDDMVIGADMDGWMVSMYWSSGGVVAVTRQQLDGMKMLVPSPDGNFLAAIGYDDQAWIWDIDTFHPIAVLSGPPDGA